MLDRILPPAGSSASPVLVEGWIATEPDADGLVEVVIPSFSEDLRHGPMPCSRPEATRGDRCLVAFAERAPWVVGLDLPHPDVAGDLVALDARLDAVEALPEAWRNIGAAGEPAFAGTWTNYGGLYTVARFRKERGFIRLDGCVKSGTNGSTAFILPPGYRPATRTQYAVPAWNGTTLVAASVFVLETGAASVRSADGTVGEIWLTGTFAV